MDMAVSALFPILLIVPLFDILMYFNIPKDYWGIAGSRRLHVSQIESFFGVEMMFLGNTKRWFNERMNEMRT